MSTFDILTFEEAVGRILRTMRTSRSEVPFTIVAGAGLSVPLIPTAWQMVQDIPQWLKKREAVATPLREYRRSFWERLKTHDTTLALNARHLPDENIPENIGKAYQLAMSVGLSSPELRRQYILDVIDGAGPKTNYAQLFLASILAAQDRPEWGFKVPFCRTLFTTNFDPLLQRALQLMGALYYISDRPSSLETPFDTLRQGVHLIHSHGSLFQYRLANTENEVRNFAAEQEGKLPDYLEKHGIIVVGYSGWCDVCMEALGQCAQFGHNLYWCDIHAPEEAEDRLRGEVVTLLRKHRSNAYYVQIHGADSLFQGLHVAMGMGDVPAVVSNPIAMLQERLECISGTKGISGTSVFSFAATLDQSLKTLQLLSNLISSPDMAENDWGNVVWENHLSAAIQNAESGNLPAAEQLLEELLKDERRNGESRFRVTRLRAEIRADYDDLHGALSDLTAALEIESISASERADSLLKRSEVWYELDNMDDAINDASQAFSCSNDPESRSAALHRRAILYSEIDEHTMAIADLNAMLDSTETPPEWRALAYGNRALAWDRLGEPEKSLADFESALKIDQFNPEFAAQAYLFRGRHHQKTSDFESAIDDFTTVIESPDSEREAVLDAFRLRAECKESLGDDSGARVDYSKAANADRDAAEAGVMALVNRAACHSLAGQYESAVADYSVVIEAVGETNDELELLCRVQRAANLQPLERFNEMLDDLNIVLSSENVTPDLKSLAFGLRGSYHLTQRHSKETLLDLKRAEESCKKFSDRWWGIQFQCGLAMCLDGDTSETITFFDTMLASAPPERTQYEIHDLRASMFLSKKSLEQAYEAARSAWKLIDQAEPTELADAYYQYSFIFLKNGAYSEALSMIQQGLQFAEGERLTELRLLEVKCLSVLERSCDALTKLDDLLAENAFVDQFLTEAMALRGQLLVDLGRYGEALLVSDRLRDDADNKVAMEALGTYARALLRLNRNIEARDALLGVAETEEVGIICQLCLAMSQLRLGAVTAAVECMDKCTKLVESARDLHDIVTELKRSETAQGEFSSLISVVENHIEKSAKVLG